MTNMRVELNHAGVAALLDGPEAQALVQRLANRIAAAAGDGMEAAGDPQNQRARAVVYTATFPAKLAEAHGRALTRAIEAGRA